VNTKNVSFLYSITSLLIYGFGLHGIILSAPVFWVGLLFSRPVAIFLGGGSESVACWGLHPVFIEMLSIKAGRTVRTKEWAWQTSF